MHLWTVDGCDEDIFIRIRPADESDGGAVWRPGWRAAGTQVGGFALSKGEDKEDMRRTRRRGDECHELTRRRPDEIGHLVAYACHRKLRGAALNAVGHICHQQ